MRTERPKGRLAPSSAPFIPLYHKTFQKSSVFFKIFYFFNGSPFFYAENGSVFLSASGNNGKYKFYHFPSYGEITPEKKKASFGFLLLSGLEKRFI